MVVNTLKISFCADHSWREGARESSGERRRKGGEERRGMGAFKKSTLLIKRERQREKALLLVSPFCVLSAFRLCAYWATSFSSIISMASLCGGI